MTDRYESLLSESGANGARAVTKEMRRIHPLGRFGRLDEVAEVVASPLSNAASSVSAGVIPVDGGRTALGRHLKASDASGDGRG